LERGFSLTAFYTQSRREGKRFVVVDAGMNDLIRPALYGSFQRIEKVKKPARPCKRPTSSGRCVNLVIFC